MGILWYSSGTFHFRQSTSEESNWRRSQPRLLQSNPDWHGLTTSLFWIPTSKSAKHYCRCRASRLCFQLLTAKEVQEQITECGRVFDSSVSVDQNLTSARSINRSKRLHPLLFYRVSHALGVCCHKSWYSCGAIAADFLWYPPVVSNQHHGSKQR